MSAVMRYSLQGSSFDVPMRLIQKLPPSEIDKFLLDFLAALVPEIDNGTMALKSDWSDADEMADLRRLFNKAPDAHLYLNDHTNKRRVLAVGAPGRSHVRYSRFHIWKMKTKMGHLPTDIRTAAAPLVEKLRRLLDPGNPSKEVYRDPNKSVILNIFRYLQSDRSVGTAFPPFHARYFADRFLPRGRDCIVADTSAGHGGRLLGDLMVPRAHHVHYIGVDPEIANKSAYDTLTERAQRFSANRSSEIHYEAAEDWLKTRSAKSRFGSVDLVITSPPYYCAENYNPDNPLQSANRYSTYPAWLSGFYRPIIQGAFDLLRPGGYFVLNVASVQEAPLLEHDTRILAYDAGFDLHDIYSLALCRAPGTRQHPGSNVVRSLGVFYKAEPVFVFKKQGP